MPSRAASRRRRRTILVGVSALAVLALAAALLHAIDDGDRFGLLDGEGSQRWRYVAVFFLITADALVPIFPSESTLNAASTSAAAGDLELWLVILVGALGAIAGDSALYWLSRVSGSRVRRRLEKAKTNRKVAAGLAFIGDSAPLLIVAGRYVPGLRFAVSASMGLARYPYRRFLLWLTVGAATWSLYTCLLAYWIGTALADFPLASIIISALVTTALLGALAVAWRRSHAPARGSTEAAAS
jgi:membrane-associated protein